MCLFARFQIRAVLLGHIGGGGGVSDPYGEADADTQRLILEARDPSSGIVIYQIPPKSAIRQLSSSASAAPG